MNAVFVSPLTFLAAFALTLPAHADDACDPRVVQSETRYPFASQVRQQAGAVYLDVIIAEDGRAQSAQIVDSSGYRLLDRAATQSVMRDWLFDVSACERKDLPARDTIAVEYRLNP